MSDNALFLHTVGGVGLVHYAGHLALRRRAEVGGCQLTAIKAETPNLISRLQARSGPHGDAGETRSPSARLHLAAIPTGASGRSPQLGTPGLPTPEGAGIRGCN